MASKKEDVLFSVGVELDSGKLTSSSTKLKTELQKAKNEAKGFEDQLKKVAQAAAKIKMNPEQYRTLANAKYDLSKLQKNAGGRNSFFNVGQNTRMSRGVRALGSGIAVGGWTSKLAGVGGLAGPEGAIAGALVGLGIDLAEGVVGMIRSVGQFTLEAMEAGQAQQLLEGRVKREFAGSSTKGFSQTVLDMAKKMAQLEGVSQKEALQGILPLAREIDSIQVGSSYVERATGKRKIVKTQAEADAVKEASLNDPVGMVRQAADLSVLTNTSPRETADNIDKFLEAYTSKKNGTRMAASAAASLIGDLDVPKARKVLEQGAAGTLAQSVDISEQNKKDMIALGLNLHKALAGDEMLMALRIVAGQGLDAAEMQRQTIDFSLKKLRASLTDSIEVFGEGALEAFGFDGAGKSGLAAKIDELTAYIVSPQGVQAIKDFGGAVGNIGASLAEFVNSGTLSVLFNGLTGLANLLAYVTTSRGVLHLAAGDYGDYDKFQEERATARQQAKDAVVKQQIDDAAQGAANVYTNMPLMDVFRASGPGVMSSPISLTINVDNSGAAAVTGGIEQARLIASHAVDALTDAMAKQAQKVSLAARGN